MSNAVNPRVGRTRWRRFAALAAPAVLAASGILLMEGQGALAASFRVSGLPAVITADHLVGTGFGQYGYFDAAYPNKNAGIDAMIPVAITGIRSATINNLCQSVTIPGFNVSLVIKAGTKPDRPVEATNLFIDMTKLSGDAKFTNIEIGNDASDLYKGKGPAGLKGAPNNMFGQQADVLEISNLKQTIYSTSAGTFVLKDMDMQIKWGSFTCPQ